MATITQIYQESSAAHQLRAFDARRDLLAVADLVEQCFADTLDADGARYLDQMRQAAKSQGLLRWASAGAEWADLPMGGYVWEEDGRLVGNLSLIPYHIQGKRFFLIANVAVHPDYRRRGIARQLTMRGIEHARRRKAPAVWLHVREENDAAVTLYRELGFVERARRTTWVASPQDAPGTIPPGLAFSLPPSFSWKLHQDWLLKQYPPELTWHMPFKLKLLRPGWIGMLTRLFHNSDIRQWTVHHNGRPLGFLSWQATSAPSNILWLATPPEYEDLAAQALLTYARQQLRSRRRLALDYTARRAEDAIRSAGFSFQQTLIWMSIVFKESR